MLYQFLFPKSTRRCCIQSIKRLVNIWSKSWISYRSQDKSNGRNRNWIKEIRIYKSFISFILEPHHVNGFLNDRVIVDSFTLAVWIQKNLILRVKNGQRKYKKNKERHTSNTNPLSLFSSSAFLRFSAIAFLLCPLSKPYKASTSDAVLVLASPRTWDPRALTFKLKLSE